MKTILITFILSLLLPLCGKASSDDHADKSLRSHTIYVELLGASNTIGITYDSRFSSNTRWGYRTGISYYKDPNTFARDDYNVQGFFIPLGVNYLFGKKNHALEIGFGTDIGYMRLDQSSRQGPQYDFHHKTFVYYFFSDIGYRYQSRHGFLFRIGLNPSFSFKDKYSLTKDPSVFPYLGIGYRF